MKGMARLKGNLPAHTDTWLHRGFALCALFLLVFFFAFLGDAAPAPRKVTSVPSGGKVVSLEEWEDLCLLAYSGDAPGSGAVAALERQTGETQAQYALESGSLLWAAVRGGSLFLLSQEGETALLTQLSLPQLTEVATRPLQTAASSLALSSCDSEGRVFYVQDGSLWMEATQGPSEIVAPDQLSGVTFMGITPLDGLFVSTSSFCFWGSTSQLDALSRSPLLFPPLSLVGEGHYLTSLGMLYSYEGELAYTGMLPTTPLLCSMDREGHLIYGSDGQVDAYDLSEGSLGSVSLRGQLMAVCGSGAITLEEDAYWFTPVQFFQEPAAPSPTPTPSPSPTPSPNPSPSPSPTPPPSPSPGGTGTPSPSPEVSPAPNPSPSPSPWPSGISREGDWLVAPWGTTVSQVLSYFQPDAVSVTRPDGTQVTSGSVATGMTVEGFTLVALGDCDGSGTVSRSDLQQAQSLLLEGDDAGTPARRAADLDGDGVLTTLDLVLLEQLIP